MAAERGLPKFKPPHPGAYLRLDILPALGMTITELAEHLQISRASLSELVNERRSVSVEMAQRLGQAFGNGTRFWMTLQRADTAESHGIPVTSFAGLSQ